jgi:hypothetical protein
VSVKKGYNFEYSIKKALEAYLNDFDIKGHVRREFQRFASFLGTDITIDTLDGDLYIAVECKSIDLNKKSNKNVRTFPALFHTRKDGRTQFDTITQYLEATGRSGYLCVELKRGEWCGMKFQTQAFFMPWCDVEAIIRSRAISINDVCNYPCLTYSHQKYTIPRGFFPVESRKATP